MGAILLAGKSLLEIAACIVSMAPAARSGRSFRRSRGASG